MLILNISVKCSKTKYLFSDKISDFTVQYPLVLSAALLNYMVMFC